MKKLLYFPISIDMGSSSTGIYNTFYQESPQGIESLNDLGDRNSKGKGFLIHNGNLSSVTYDQTKRRAFRSSRKALKRCRSAKRLALLALESLGITLTDAQEVILRFLMNRRGFTYLEIDIKEQEKIEKVYDLLRVEEALEGISPYLEDYNFLVKEKWIPQDKWQNLKNLLEEASFPFPILEEPFDLWAIVATFLFQTLLSEEEREESFTLEEMLVESLLEVFLTFYNKGKYWFALQKKKEKKEETLTEKEQEFYDSLDLKEVNLLLQIEKPLEGRALKESLEAILKEFKQGQRSRERVFLELKEDLTNPHTSVYSFFQAAIHPKLSLNEFMNLLGNIINLQNRYLRNYFHYGSDYHFQEKGDIWQSEKAYRLYQKYIKRIFSSTEKKELTVYLEEWYHSPKKDNFAWALTQIPYEKTIPPFESNNNRHTPKCSHIHLNYAFIVSSLNGRESLLKEFIDQLVNLYPEYDHDLSNFPLGKDKQELLWINRESRIFHRFLDSTYALLKGLLIKMKGEDFWGKKFPKGGLHFHIIEHLSFTETEKEDLKELLKKSKEEQGHIKALEKDVTYQEAGEIRELTLSHAYRMREPSLIASSPFILCDLHPPLKKKRKNSYLQKFFSLGEEESLVFFQALEKRYFQEETKKAKGEKVYFYDKIGEFKELRDSLGNYLNRNFLSSQRSLRKHIKDKKGKISFDAFREEKVLGERDRNLILITTFLSQELYAIYSRVMKKHKFSILEPSKIAPWRNGGESLGLKETKKGYEIFPAFLIHPSLIFQLIDILLASKGKGFAKECSSCHIENSWRTSFQEEGEVLIEGQRSLPLSRAGDIPFSGRIRRFCQALSLRVTKTLIPSLKEELEKQDLSQETSLILPLFIEKNSFYFEEVLSRRRGKKKEVKKDENLPATRKPLSDIRYSPYEGIDISRYDPSELHLDHIISRSFSRSLGKGLVFNSEVNLIPCTEGENKRKGSSWVSLDELNLAHMNNVFGDLAKERDYSAIKNFIKERLSPYVNKKKSYNNFKRLNEEDKRAFRYSLFMWQDSLLSQEEKDFLLFHVLKMSQRTTVNGTQMYFLQSLKKNIEQALLTYRKEKGLSPENLNVSFTLKVVDVVDYRQKVFSDFRQDLRTKMAENKESLVKEDWQTPYSHIIDAYIIYNMGHFFIRNKSSISGMRELENLEHQREKLNEEKREALSKSEEIQENSFTEGLVRHLPKSYQIHSMDSLEMVSEKKTNKASKPLFKTSFYGERFLPLVISKEGLGFGFSANNFYLSDPEGFKSPLYALLYPYLKNREGLPTPEQIEEESFIPCHPCVRKFDRVKIQKFLTQTYHEKGRFPKKEKSLSLEELFFQISYRTSRMGISSATPLADLKKIIDSNDLIRSIVDSSSSLGSFFDKEFKPVSIKKGKEGKTLISGKEKKLRLPYFYTWQELKNFYQKFKKEGVQKEEALREALGELELSFKEGQKQSPLKHGVKGKKFSLIVLTNMGDLRIKRRDPKGKEFFQLFDSITKTKGFILTTNNKGEPKPQDSSFIFSPNISSTNPSTRFLAEDTRVKKDDIAIKEDYFIFHFKDNFLLRMAYSFPEAQRRDFLIRLSKESPLWQEFLSFQDKPKAFQEIATTPFSLSYKGENKKEKNESSSLARAFLQEKINEVFRISFPNLSFSKDFSIGAFNEGTTQVIYQVSEKFIDIFFRTAGSTTLDNLIYSYSLNKEEYLFSKGRVEDFFNGGGTYL